MTSEIAKIVKEGNKVSVHYEGTFESGETFDTSKGREPLEFVVGQHQVVRGFEDAVLGMKVGETKKVTIPPEKAYGLINDNLQQKIPKAKLPSEIPLKKGGMLAMKAPTGQVFPVKIKDILDDEVVIDLNHPLAGKTLIFNITVEKIN